MDLFSPRLGEGSMNIQFTMIIDLFIPRLRGGSVNIQFRMIMDLFSPCLRKGEFKYSIHNDNAIIHPPPERGGIKILNL